MDERSRAHLRQARIALAGIGGVGGAHLEALVRLGIGAFHLADPDAYDVVNLNRQLGATMASIGRKKAEVACEMAASINPSVQSRCFSAGITADNLDEFLAGVDVVVDGIEYFRLEVRQLLHRACRIRRIPVIVAGPIGYGCALLVFTPDGMSFDDYFGIDDDMTQAERLIAFSLGLAPGLGSDIDPARVDIERQKGPALASACLLCASAAATEAVKVLSGHGQLVAAPRGIYIDLYRHRTVRLRRRPHLRKSLIGRLLRWAGFRKYPAFRAMHERELRERGFAA